MNAKKWLKILGIGVLVLTSAFLVLTLWPQGQSSLNEEANGRPKQALLAEGPPNRILAAQPQTSAASAVQASSRGPSAQEAQERSDSAPELRAYLLKKSIPGRTWVLSQDSNGRVYSLTGGYLAGAGETLEKAEALAREIAPLLGVPADQVVTSKDSEKLTHPLNKTYTFEQAYGGYSVFGGSLRLFSRVPDGTVYVINNDLRQIGTPELTIRIQATELPAILNNYFAGKTAAIESVGAQPVLYSESTGNSQLAWRVAVQITAPLLDHREVLVSAATGAILKDTSKVIRN